MEQLILHLFGDYILQSDWMAIGKRKNFSIAVLHGAIYSFPFLLITKPLSAAWWVIYVSHILIDWLGLARYVCWAKNFLAPWSRRRTFTETIEDLKSNHDINPGPTSDRNEVKLILEEQKRLIRVNPPWAQCSATGYPPDRPVWLAMWLLIVADNTLHLAINYAALRWL